MQTIVCGTGNLACRYYDFLKNMIKKAFGEVLKEVRTAKGMSQDALAFASELDRTYISLLERGKRQPSLTALFKLSSALDTSPVEIVARVQGKLKGE